MKEDPIFRDAVTSTAFNLSLSKRMIFTLCQIATAERVSAAGYRAAGFSYDFVSPSKSLKARGLVYAPDPKYAGITELTEAGKHVFALLQIARLVYEFNPANAEEPLKRKAE